MANLTESQLRTLICALRVASEVYAKHAEESRGTGNERIADQFDRQVAEAHAIEQLIENAESIAITTIERTMRPDPAPQPPFNPKKDLK